MAWLCIGERLLRASPGKFEQVLEGLDEVIRNLEAVKALNWRMVFSAPLEIALD